jgi:hypothetical protein
VHAAVADSPAEIKVEFGLDMHDAEAGAFVAAASTAANFKISVIWRRSSAGVADDGADHDANE